MTGDFLIYWPQRPQAQGICVLILAILGVGLLLAIRQGLHFIFAERPALERVKARVDASYKAEQTNTEGQPLTKARVEVSTLLQGIGPRTLIAQRLRMIDDMKARHVPVNVRTLQEITLAQVRASLGVALPPFAVNMAILLGLLGTFLGLADMVGTLGNVVGSNVLRSIKEWQDAVSGLRVALHGMNTAFVASLYGIFAAATLSIVSFVTRQIVDRFLQIMEVFTASKLLPAVLIATDEQTVLERATLTIEDAFERLATIQVHNNETLLSLDRVQTTLLDEIEKIRSITADKESRNLDEAIAAMATLSSHMPDLVKAIDRTNTALQDSLKDLGRREHFDRRMRNRILLWCAITIRAGVQALRSTIDRFVTRATGRRPKREAAP